MALAPNFAAISRRCQHCSIPQDRTKFVKSGQGLGIWAGEKRIPGDDVRRRLAGGVRGDTGLRSGHLKPDVR
jgi:hypothetical protein